MSLTLIKSKVLKQTGGTLSSDEPWIQLSEADALLEISYAHSTRRGILVVDTEKSKIDDEISNIDLKYIRWINDKQATFNGQELFWSNQIRLAALQDGLEHYVPQVLYLLRPETAYISALHFLAKELGGCTEYMDQRRFIFQNKGITNLLKNFWKKIQEVHWSGGFSPGISENDRVLLLMSVIEAFNLTVSKDGQQNRGTDSMPTPHVSLEILQEAGVYIPTLMEDYESPSEEAEQEIKESLKRNNHPDIPNIISSYLTCCVCQKQFTTGKETQKHYNEDNCGQLLKCNGCGIAFPSGKEYRLHAYTFCKQGPISQTKCPCCKTVGPKCLCQMHWQRTYGLLSTIFEGGYPKAEWLSKETYITSLLLQAAPVLFKENNITFADNIPGISPPSPIALQASLWEQQNQMLPIEPFMNEKGELSIKLKSTSIWIETTENALQKSMGITIRKQIPSKPEGDVPKSAVKTDTQKKIYRTKYMGTNLDPMKANEEEINDLATKIDTLKKKLTSETSRRFCSMTFKMSDAEMTAELDTMETILHAAIENTWAKENELSNKFCKKLNFDDQPESKENQGLGKPNTASKTEKKEPFNHKKQFTQPEMPKNKGSGRKTPENETGMGKSPEVSIASSMRGGSKTETLLRKLNRSINILSSKPADKRSSTYKRYFEELRDCNKKVLKHLEEDPLDEIDTAWQEELENAINVADDLLEKKDNAADELELIRDKEKTARAEIQKCLPRTKPLTWSGDINGFPKFKEACQMMITEYPRKELALNAMLELVENKELKSRLKIYRDPTEALASLELTYGKPELSGPKIREDMKRLPIAGNMKEESEIIQKIITHYAELKSISQQGLLGKDVLLNLCHKLRMNQGMEILAAVQSLENPDDVRNLFFKKLDELYSLNTLWYRTEMENRPQGAHRAREGAYGVQYSTHQGKAERGKTYAKESHNRMVSTKPGKESRVPGPNECKICKGDHSIYKCPNLQKIDLPQIQKLGICSSCLRPKHAINPNCAKWKSFGKEGNSACGDCKNHWKLEKLHINCKKSEPRQSIPRTKEQRHNWSSQPANPPQLTQEAKTATTDNRMTNLRIKVGMREFATRNFSGPLLNPTPLNASLELIDTCIIQAPDGTLRKCRVVHDQFGAGDTLADVQLARYSHSTMPVDMSIHTATGTQKLQTSEFVLKIILPNGKSESIKAVATDMRSQKAFHIIQKVIDVPIEWNNRFFSNKALIGENKSIRFLNLVEGPEVEILLGSDNSFLAPKELERFKDSHGCATMYKSMLQNEQFLVGGGRIVGCAVVPLLGSQQRSFRLGDTGEQVSVRRISTERPESVLFPAESMAKLSKVDQKFMKEFSDNNLLPPHPRACEGCEKCPTCSNVFATQNRQAMEKLLDSCCKLDATKSWSQGGGWSIKLLWNDRLKNVPVNKGDAIQRLLATERSLCKNPAAKETFNAQVEKCLKLKYFVLLKDYTKSLEGKQISYLPLSYALKDTEGNLDPEQPSSKIKARPVSDGSHKNTLQTPSVNEALVPLPDLWTGKIQHLLLKFRTSKRLALADISQYFHRLHLDETSIAMTLVMWREGGLGSDGPLVTMVIPSASMGLTPVPALASHCRARTADNITDSIAKCSIKRSYVDDIFLPTLWQTTGKNCGAEADKVLLDRIQQTNNALNKASLNLGDGWLTDLPQSLIPQNVEGIQGVSKVESEIEIGASTGALGMRWRVGGNLPDGGTFSYRVHRPGSINLLKKQRGKRPAEGELRNRDDIKKFLQSREITKAGLVGLVMNLWDPLGLAIPWTATAKLLYRQVLTESPSLGWKSKIPSRYYKQIEDLGADLLMLSSTHHVPRRALKEGPDGQIGHVTLILVHDGSAESGCVLAYIHQQWPHSSAVMPSIVTGKQIELNEENISVEVNLLCGSHKLTETGHHDQVAGELLSTTIAVRLKQVITEQSLVPFDQVIYLGDSLTVARVIRKSDRAYSPWAAARVSYIQRSEELSRFYHVPGKFLLGTADKGTRAHVNPSTLLNEDYWKGKGSLDIPLHKLPITDPTTYVTMGLDCLPENWINKSVVQLQPPGLDGAMIYCNRVEVEEQDHEVQGVDRLKVSEMPRPPKLFVTRAGLAGSSSHLL